MISSAITVQFRPRGGQLSSRESLGRPPFSLHVHLHGRKDCGTLAQQAFTGNRQLVCWTLVKFKTLLATPLDCSSSCRGLVSFLNHESQPRLQSRSLICIATKRRDHARTFMNRSAYAKRMPPRRETHSRPAVVSTMLK